MLLALLAYRDITSYGFVEDADLLIAQNDYIKHLGNLWANVTHDYFWSQAQTGIPYWRPVTKGSWVLEYALFRGWPGGFLLVQLAWFVLGVIGVQALALLCGATRPFAALAGVLFALHPVAIDPVCLIMARSDVVSATCLLWSLWAYARALRPREGSSPVPMLALHLLTLALALGSKEQAVVIVPVLLLWAALARVGAEPRPHLSPPATPLGNRPFLFLLPALALVAVYLVARRLVLHGMSQPAPVTDPLRVLVGASFYLKGLLPLRITSGVRNLSLSELRDPTTIATAAALVLAVTAGALYALRRRLFAVPLILAWIGASVLPVLVIANLSVPYAAIKVPLADRWLLQGAAVSSVLYALCLERLRRQVVTRCFVGAVVLWAAATLALSSRSHGVYRTGVTLLDLEDRLLDETPPQHRTPEDACLAVDRRVARELAIGDAAMAVFIFQEMPTHCELTGSRLFNHFSLLVGLKRYSEARPHLAKLLAGPLEGRYMGPAYYLGGVTLLNTGDPKEGEVLLRRAERMGVAGRNCNVYVHLAHAANLQGHPADEAAARAQAAACLAKKALTAP